MGFFAEFYMFKLPCWVRICLGLVFLLPISCSDCAIRERTRCQLCLNLAILKGGYRVVDCIVVNILAKSCVVEFRCFFITIFLVVEIFSHLADLCVGW